MKETFYKHLSFSFLIIVIWMSYLFFDYFLEPKGMFNGLGLLINFMVSCFFALISGIIITLIRYIMSKKHYKKISKTDFLFVFAGLLNLIIFLLFIVAVLLKILDLKTTTLFYFLGNLGLALFIIYNINKLKTR
jgi:hypothetical protein